MGLQMEKVFSHFALKTLMISIILLGPMADDPKAYVGNTGAIITNGNYVLTGTNQGVYRMNMSDGSIKHYTQSDGLASQTVNAIVADRSGALWFGTNNGISRFDGTTWNTYTTADGLASNSIIDGALDTDGSLWFLTALGASHFKEGKWSNYTAGDGLGMNPVALAVGTDGTKWFGYNNIVSSFDGEHWKTYTLFEATDDTPWIRKMACDAEGRVWVGFLGPFGGKVMMFDGVSWITCPENEVGGGNITALTIGPNDEKWFYSQHYLYRFDNHGWISFFAEGGDDVVPSGCTGITTDTYGRVWMVSRTGVVRFDGSSWVTFSFLNSTKVQDETNTMQPDILFQNNPNPFNPRTAVSFILQKSGRVNIAIFSSTGQKVRSLTSGYLQAGTHSVIWDGKDDRGESVSSGMYLSRFESGKGAYTNKMLLMR